MINLICFNSKLCAFSSTMEEFGIGKDQKVWELELIPFIRGYVGVY